MPEQLEVPEAQRAQGAGRAKARGIQRHDPISQDRTGRGSPRKLRERTDQAESTTMKDITLYTSKFPKTAVLTGIKNKLEKYLEAGQNLVDQATRAEITDEDTYAKGGDLISIARAQSKKVEEERTELVGPFNKLVKFINSAYKLPKERFTDARSIIETKMLTWKRKEDEKLRKEAIEEAARVEAEALERAALEKTEAGQDEVLEAAGDAAKEIVEQSGVGLKRGDYGSSTGTRKFYSIEVANMAQFMGALLANIANGNSREIDLGALFTMNVGPTRKFAERLYKAGVRTMPGAKITEAENIRVY